MTTGLPNSNGDTQQLKLECDGQESFTAIIQRFLTGFRAILKSINVSNQSDPIITVPVIVPNEEVHARLRKKFDKTPNCLRDLGIETVSVAFINPDKINIQITRNTMQKILGGQGKSGEPADKGLSDPLMKLAYTGG